MKKLDSSMLNTLTIDDLLRKVSTYNISGIDKIKSAYLLASRLHEGTLRKSGEPYIIHPLNVAYILASVNADTDTICAGLLHDTLEDTDITKEELKELFGEDVANLVDGVTKISRMNFSSELDPKEAQDNANFRKIVTSITEDIRIIMIKFADRLHNMRTIGFKSEFKQKENALETLELYAPCAKFTGEYDIKNELEDLSFKIIDPVEYARVYDLLEELTEEYDEKLHRMADEMQEILVSKGIPSSIRVRTKSVYSMWKQLESGKRFNAISDVFAIKIATNSYRSCYDSHRLIIDRFPVVPDKFKDYIERPKTNGYQSLHDVLSGPDDVRIHLQIRTNNMDLIASTGLFGYWSLNKDGRAREVMQDRLREKFPVYRSIKDLNEYYGYEDSDANRRFVARAKKELFSKHIFVTDLEGEIHELPWGSTGIDFAYDLSETTGDKLVGIIVNGIELPPMAEVHSKDIVGVITDANCPPHPTEWSRSVRTTKAKSMILSLGSNI